MIIKEPGSTEIRPNIYTWSGRLRRQLIYWSICSQPLVLLPETGLRLNPDWNLLRDHPWFRELIACEDEPYLEGP